MSKRAHFLKAASLAVALSFLLASATGCGTKSSDPNKIVVGCKQFTEQYIIGEMLAQLLEAKTDFKVERKFGLGNVEVIQRAILQGDIDLFPEYTASGLYAQLKEDFDTRDPDAIYQRVKEKYKEKWDIRWLSPLGFNNTYALCMTREAVESLGIKKYSDLAPHAAGMSLGGSASYFDRQDGHPGLVETYGFDFKRTVSMDSGLMYQALKQGEVDVISAFSTDGRIAAYDLVLLEDDKQFFPPYYLAPIVRGEVLDKNPGLEEILDSLAGAIDEATMASLNAKVDLENREAADVAAEFLREKGLID